jgi:propanediol dehydratase small subunit
MKMNHYPLRVHHADTVRSAGNHTLDEIQIDNINREVLSPKDLNIHADTLLAQANISRQAGFTRLSENLTRAAELTQLSNQELLQLYDRLRPGRSSYAELIGLANLLEEKYHAVFCAQLFREAAEIYKVRKLFRKEDP